MGYMDLAKSYSNQMRVVEAPASGGGLSQNGKFSYGYASSAGKRSSMEDFFETRIDGVDGEIVGLFGVFDGHGGAKAAEYVKRHLFSNLITHPKFISDTKSAITDAYNHTDSELLKSDTKDAGSTASTAILVGDRLVVANVGDSRAVICRGGNAFAVSRDHKPDQSDERERIENAGGFVMWAGTWRVGGVLAVSRAFGDRLLKQYVVADPEIQEEKIDESLEFLILASDGLWDVFSNEEAVAVVKEVEDPEESSKKLVGEAIKRGSADNITCVVVRFLESKSSNNKGSEISSTHASSSKDTKRSETAVQKDSDHKISTKETNQDQTGVHSDVDRNAESENFNNKPIAARGNNSDHISSTQKQITARSNDSSDISSVQKPISARSNDSSQISSIQKPISARSNDTSNSSSTQKQVSVRSNDSGHISATQKPVSVRSNNLGHISSTQKPTAERSISSEKSGPASQKNQMPIVVSSGSEATTHELDRSIANQKQKITTTQTTPSELSGSTGQKNQKPTAIHSDSSAKQHVHSNSSAKQHVHSDSSKQHVHAHDKLDISIANPKQHIAATHTTSSKSGSTCEKDQKPVTIHSDSTKQHVQAHNELDRSIANSKQHIAATHAASSTSEKNQKLIATHNETGTSKAKSLHSNTN